MRTEITKPIYPVFEPVNFAKRQPVNLNMRSAIYFLTIIEHQCKLNVNRAKSYKRMRKILNCSIQNN